MKCKILFLLCSFLVNCFGYLKPIPILDETKTEKLKQDNEFVFLDENLKPVEFKIKDAGKEILKYQTAKTISEKNSLAIYGLKLDYVLESEKIFLENFKSTSDSLFVYLNLHRLYYQLEEFEECRKITKEFFNKNKNLKFQAIDYLQKRNRIEEKIILLDMVSNESEFESKSLEELGTYFLNNGNYTQAEFYFNKVLATYAFNKTALIGMMQIKLNEENYKQVIDYGSILEKEKPTGVKFTYLQSKAYFEIGEYEKSIKLIESSSESEKLDLEVLNIWRDSYYSIDPKKNLDRLKSYLQKLNKNQTFTENFFYRDTKLGKKNSDFILYGF